LEDGLRARGFSPIAGVDEAGRGPLAGPVVACAVVLPAGCVIEGVIDSKQLSPARRAALADEIKKSALAYAFGIAEADEIDRINILQAAMQAMQKAVKALPIPPSYVLVDGNRLPRLPCKGEAVVKGDSNSHLIAAASILAKEERDRYMDILHSEYPQYGFADHKGYGTARHLAALAAHGACAAHRLTFKGVRENPLRASLGALLHDATTPQVSHD